MKSPGVDPGVESSVESTHIYQFAKLEPTVLWMVAWRMPPLGEVFVDGLRLPMVALGALAAGRAIVAYYRWWGKSDNMTVHG